MPYLKKMILIKPAVNCWILFLAFIICGLINTAPAYAAAVSDNLELAEDSGDGLVYKDNLGRDTPRSSFTGFLKLTEKFDFETAAEFIDLRNLPHGTRQYSGEELARKLDFVIQRGMKTNPSQLSNKTTGQVVDGLPEYLDELGPVVTDEGELVLLLQRVPGPDESFIWKVSNKSVAELPKLYDYFSYPDWIEKIREKFPEDIGFMGIELFKWVIVLGIVFLSTPGLWLLGFILSRLFTRSDSILRPEVQKLFTWPLILLGFIFIGGHLLRELGLGATAQAVFETKTLMTFVVVWILFLLIDLARAKRRQTFIAQGRSDAHILGRPMANALKLLVLLVAMLVWLHNTGINITTLLAGLGVGGVALALALQKPIEDLLGAVSIYSQQPIVTGDLCKYGNVLGRIEEIGLRTTRIRTLNNTLVSIPNCIIAHGAIENYSAREKMLYHPELPLRYDTSGEQMQAIINGIDKLAKSQEKVIEKSVRIRFTEFAENAMIIKARIYIDTDNFSDYLAVVGNLNLGIMEVVQAADAHFAQGAKTIMLESTGVSAD